MKKLIFPFLILGFLLTSCENDDDVCVSGEATPRLKIKFKSADNKSTDFRLALFRCRLW